MEYEMQATTVENLIKQLKKEKEAIEDKVKMGIKRIRMMVGAWRDQMKIKIDDCSTAVWNQWSKQAAELQLIRADAENEKKVGDNFYKMDEESIVTIQEELSNDFYALAETQLEAVWKLIDGIEDDQLRVQLQLEGYEWERRRKEAEKKVEQINISDEDQQPETRASTQQQQHQ